MPGAYLRFYLNLVKIMLYRPCYRSRFMHRVAFHTEVKHYVIIVSVFCTAIVHQWTNRLESWEGRVAQNLLKELHDRYKQGVLQLKCSGISDENVKNYSQSLCKTRKIVRKSRPFSPPFPSKSKSFSYLTRMEYSL